METKYQEWDNKKDFLCDGKKAYEEIKSKLCPKLGITPKKFEQTISLKLYSIEVYDKYFNKNEGKKRGDPTSRPESTAKVA